MTKHDLTTEAEKKLDELFPDTIVFVHDWPIAGKPFYIMQKQENSLFTTQLLKRKKLRRRKNHERFN